MPRRTLRALLASAFLAAPAAAQPFGPTGFESRANTYTTGHQFSPDAAYALFESFVVVWYGEGAGGAGSDVFGQRFAATGARLGAEFRVNTYTSGPQGGARVAMASNGRFAVVWNSDDQDGNSQGIFGQRFAASGAPEGGEFRVNTTTTGYQSYIAVAANGNLEFLVVWASANGGTNSDIWAQRFTSTGAPGGPEFRVNTTTTSADGHPAVTRGLNGFVVVWEGANVHGPGTYAISGRRFDGTGAPAGAEFTAAAGTTQFSRPSVGVAASGGFVVAWHQSTGSYADSYVDVMARRLDGTGLALGAAFRVNTYTTSVQTYPQVSANPFASPFAVVWQSYGEDGSITGLYGQRFLGTGVPAGAPFRVNTFTTDAQFVGHVDTGTTGDFVVTWTGAAQISSGQDGNGAGAFFQRYCRTLAGDVDGNQVVAVGDVLYLINYLFAGGPQPFLSIGDVNGDGAITVTDVLYLINHLFAGGPPPVCAVDIA